MPYRIRPGLARVFVQVAALVLLGLTSAPAPDTVRRPPGRRILVAAAEAVGRPPYPSGRRPSTASEARPPSCIRPYLVAHEQRMRRRVPVVALDGIAIGPRAIHRHLVGSPAGASLAAAA